MATIKAYTDIEQSKKLAEFLPLESADMYYACGAITPDIMIGSKQDYRCYIICWSLAALLDILPKAIVCNKHIVYLEFHAWENSLEYVNNAGYTLYVTEGYDSPINACYEMIIKLKENGLI